MYNTLITKRMFQPMLKNFLKSIKPKNCIVCALGGIILALGMYNIHSVANITEGGTLGLILLLEHHFGISPAISEIVLNLICYGIGIKAMGAVFLVYSAVSTSAFSIAYGIFECFPRIYPDIASHPLIASVLGAIFVGTGVGLAVKAGGAPCGDDALAMSISRISALKIQWVYLISDITVLLLSLTYIPLGKIAYSLLSVIISGQIIGFIQNTKITKRRG